MARNKVTTIYGIRSMVDHSFFYYRMSLDAVLRIFGVCLHLSKKGLTLYRVKNIISIYCEMLG